MPASREHRPHCRSTSRPVPTQDDLLLDTMIVDPTLAIGHDKGRRTSGRCLAQGGNRARNSAILVLVATGPEFSRLSGHVAAFFHTARPLHRTPAHPLATYLKAARPRHFHLRVGKNVGLCLTKSCASVLYAAGFGSNGRILDQFGNADLTAPSCSWPDWLWLPTRWPRSP